MAIHARSTLHQTYIYDILRWLIYLLSRKGVEAQNSPERYQSTWTTKYFESTFFTFLSYIVQHPRNIHYSLDNGFAGNAGFIKKFYFLSMVLFWSFDSGCRFDKLIQIYSIHNLNPFLIGLCNFFYFLSMRLSDRVHSSRKFKKLTLFIFIIIF